MGSCLVNVYSLRTGSHGPVEIVDLPIENSDFPQSCKRLLLVNPSEKYEFVSWDDEIPN